MTWSPADEDKLRKLWAEGHTSGEISKRMRMSPSAIIGKANRLKLSPRKAAKPLRKGPRNQPWGDPNPNDPDHILDARDLRILDAVAEGGSHRDVAKAFSVPVSMVAELWRQREIQDSVGEGA